MQDGGKIAEWLRKFVILIEIACNMSGSVIIIGQWSYRRNRLRVDEGSRHLQQ